MGSTQGMSPPADAALRRLEHTVHEIAGPGIPDKGVLVSLDDFFDGNDVEWSIAPNLVVGDPNPVMRHPGLEVVRGRLEEVRDRPDVAGVYVDLMIEWDVYPEGEWPYAQAIQVVTTADPQTVDSWLEGLNADPSFAAAVDDEPWVNPPAVPDGYEVLTVWWD
jgi:hypothetical protein